MTPREFAELAKLPPTEAIAYMQRRKLLTVSYDWFAVWNDEHARQFTVSRLARLDLLQKVHDSITESVSGDLSRHDWMKDIKKVLTDAGWWGEKTLIDPDTGEAVTTRFNPSRLKLIYDTNTRSAYSAGMWERSQRTKRTHPYFRYVTQRDERVRHAHALLDNVTLPVDDPFWDTHCPPNGYRCRCRLVPVSRLDYDRGKAPTGAPLVKQAPPVVMRDWLDRKTGEIRQVPVGVDPGFGHNPGKASADLDRMIADKIAGASPGLAAAAAADGFKES